MKWFAIIVAVVLLLPLLILCYATVLLGCGYSDEQWEIAQSMALAGVLLEVIIGTITICMKV